MTLLLFGAYRPCLACIAPLVQYSSNAPVTGQGFTSGKLLDGTGCQILLNTGATKSYMSKSFYLKCKCLHTLPKFASHTQRI